MSKFDSLHTLDLLLLDSLSKDDLNQLAGELHKESCISEDSLKILSQIDSEKELSVAITNAVFERANPGVDTVLVSCLKRIGKHAVAKIAECWFDPNERQRVGWILYSWNEMLKREKHIKESTSFMTSKKLSDEHWLVDFCYFVASEETDSEVKTKLIEMLQNSMSDSDASLMDTAGFEFISISSIQAESPHASYDVPPPVQNFEIASTSSSDSKENFEDAPAVQGSEASVSSESFQNLSKSDQASLKQEELNTDQLPSSSSDIKDEEMADDTSSIGVISESMESEVVPFEDVDMKEVPQQLLHSTPENTEVVLTEDGENPDTLVTISQDVERTLFALMPLLQSCLSERDIKDIGKEMHFSDHITRETFESFKKKKPETVGVYLYTLFDVLREQAQENWRESFLEAINELEKVELFEVIEQYFKNTNQDLCWLIGNLETLQSRKDDLLSITAKLNFTRAIAEHEEDWMVSFLHVSMSAGEDTLRQIIIELAKLDEPQDEMFGDDEPPKTPSDRIDDLLKPLMPLLKSCMNKKEIVKLVQELALLDYCSNSKFKDFRSLSSSIDDDETFSSFLIFMKDDAKDNWEEAILNALLEREFTVLHNVVAYYFAKPESLFWFMQNWDMLQEKKEDLLSLAQQLSISINITEESKLWLLFYLNEMINLGDEAIQQLHAALTQENSQVEEEVPKTPADQISEMLIVLMPMLKACMNKREIVQLAKELVVSGYFSRDRYRHFQTQSSSLSHDELLTSLVSCMKEDVREDWKESILNAIYERGEETLRNVVAYYFDKPDMISWCLQNWDVYNNQRNELLSIAERLKFNIVVKKEAKSWLLFYLNEVINGGDEAMEQLIEELTGNRSSTSTNQVSDDQQVVKEDPRALFLRDMDSCLVPLMSVFRSYLGLKDFTDVVSELCVGNDFSKDSLTSWRQSAKSGNDFEMIYAQFLEHFKNDATNSWKDAFLQALKEEGQVVLSEVIGYHFERPHVLMSFLHNWDELLGKKLAVFTMAQQLKMYLETNGDDDETWLLFFLSQVLKRGDETLQEVIDALSRDEKSEPEKSPYPVGTIAGAFSRDVDESLTPLVQFLSFCLPSQKIAFVATRMSLEEESNLSTDSVELLKISAETAIDYKDTIELLIDSLKKEATAKWKASFLAALQNEELEELHYVVKGYFLNPNEYLFKAFANWEAMEARKKSLLEIAQSRSFCANLNADSDNIVLLIIRTAMARGTGGLKTIVKLFLEHQMIERPPVAPISRPIDPKKVVPVTTERMVTRSLAKAQATSLPTKKGDALSLQQVKLKAKNQPTYLSQTNIAIGEDKLDGAPPEPPPRNSSFLHKSAAKHRGGSGEPSQSESEDSLKETSLHSGNDVDPPKLKPQGKQTSPGKTTKESTSSINDPAEDDDDEFQDAESDLSASISSNVKKIARDFEILDENLLKKETSQQKGLEKEDAKKKGKKNETNSATTWKPWNKNICKKKVQNKEEKGTAGASGKDTKTGGKKKRGAPQQRNAPIKEKNVMDQEFSPARLQKMQYGHCLVEFRARLSDVIPTVPEGTNLFLYIDNASDRAYYPMQYSSKFNEYRIALTLKTFDTIIYKYCLCNDACDIIDWEFLVYFRDHVQNGIYNRYWTVNNEQKESRYCITFDVVILQPCSIDQYKHQLVGTHYKFLNSEIDMNEQEKDENAVLHMHYIYRNWFIDLSNGAVTHKKGHHYLDLPSKLVFKLDTKVKAVINFLGLLSENDDIVSNSLCTLAFITAINYEIDLDANENVCSRICTSLRLHKVSDDAHALFSSHLFWFNQAWSVMKKNLTTNFESLLGKVDKLFRKLAKVPESLFLFPLIKMLQSINDDTVDPDTPPKLIFGKKYVKPDWESVVNQKVIMEMGSMVLRLIERFPWMRKSYSELITVKTTSEILRDDSELATTIDTDIAFTKLITFWESVASRKPKTLNFDETDVTILISFIAKKIDQAAKSEREESDKKCVQLWLIYAEKLLKALNKYVAYNSKQCKVGPVAFLITLIDDIILHSQNVTKVVKDENTKLQLDLMLKSIASTPAAIFDNLDSSLGVSSIEIELWTVLLDYTWKAENVTENWRFHCHDSLQHALKKKFVDVEAFINFYANEFELMKPSSSLVKCFTDVLTSKVENNLEGGGRWLRFDLFSKPSLLKVIWKILKKKWFSADEIKAAKRPSKEDKLVVFLEHWPPASFFLCKLCEGWKASNTRLSTKKKRICTDITDSSKAIIISMNDGTICVGSLMVLRQIEKFWDVYDAFWKFGHYLHEGGDPTGADLKYCSKTYYEKLLKLRADELAAFRIAKTNLEDLVKFLSTLKKDGIDVDCSQLQELLDTKLVKLELKTLVKCQDPLKNNGISKVLYFPINENDMQVIKGIKETNCLNSIYARGVLVQAALKFDGQQLNISNFLEDVWKPACAVILETAEKLEKGELLFQEVGQLLEKELEATTNEQVDKQVKILFEMLRKSGVESDNLKLRSEQIQNYLIVCRQQKTAKVLLDIKKILNLKGKFDALKKPLKVDGDLNSLTRDTLKAVSSLKSITPEKLRVLRYFRRGDLLPWVKKHMKDLGEVKVMSDLAMISAGETPMEVDRVSCFLSAVMGFSPLIFDLPEDAGLQQLLDACDQVWQNVERDKRELNEREGDDERKTLLQKWIAISQQMEWLKTVRELRGSVEQSSLTRAQQINKRGIYVIRKETEKIPNVDNCLKLLIPKKEKTPKGQKEIPVQMSLSELHDLQSRLMLIAGEADKGKDDVIRFIDVLSSAENLAKAYVQLKLSGCLLFNDWFAYIRLCNQIPSVEKMRSSSKTQQSVDTPEPTDQISNIQKGSCAEEITNKYVTIEVSFDATSPKVASRRDVLQEMKELTDVLQTAHKKWMDYLFEKRNEHYHLNHYNIRQLTYLCKKLSCVEGNDFPNQVYQLLARVASSNLSYADISDCLEEVTKINDEREQFDSNVVQETSTSDTKLDKKKRVIRKLVQLEISEKVAKAAVQCIPSLDVDECYLWALENANDEEIIKVYQQNFDEEVAFGAANTDINAIQDVINDRLNLTLAQVISRIQHDIEDRNCDGVGVPVKTVCERYFGGTAVTSLEDCISLEHLGQFLTMINLVWSRQMVLPKRECPDGFNIGKPNLIICPKVDMWRTVLSIYMASPDQGLPSAAEVLVCCESTTTEEVELFLRRAIQSPNNDGTRIFCLACADEIDFNVAKDAESLYQQLNQIPGRNEEFRLIILATSLHHYITALFDEYRVDLTFMAEGHDIKNFICKNLTTQGMQCESASVVDYNKNLVRLVCSEKAGMGKSLFVGRRRQKLAKKFQGKVYWNSSTIRFLEKDVDVDDTIDTLNYYGGKEIANGDPHFVHIDITPAVQNGVHKFLFDLVILGELKSSDGMIWRRRHQHFYALEYTFPSTQGQVSFSNLLELLPEISCISPLQVMAYMQEHANQPEPEDQILMDQALLNDEMYQRPYQYLLRYTQKLDLDRFSYKTPMLDALGCLQTLLNHCSIKDPSWSELSHFSKFLNTQLHDCEKSYYLNMEDIEGLSQREIAESKMFGFKLFAVRFMIRMSQDFATPSLELDEEDENEDDQKKGLFDLHQLRRRWEHDFHPYLFFNADRMSFSFVHFNINANGDLCNPKTDAVIKKGIMGLDLVKDLKEKYHVKIQQDFDRLNREEKLETLCNVFGCKVFEPDLTYELTTDNVLKMLAIHMRFRCGIPVVIMGETGCGKTRMVDFMSRLKRGENEDVRNMVVVKVHGGITVAAIQKMVKGAVELARENMKKNLETILFLDEANTTEAIYAIKEIVCDATVHGEPFAETGLKIVAACNPYRKHKKEMIEKMEQSGLGFHVKTENVTDTFADIPMRHLVYRVIPLPPSMQPLVWDFGQLNNNTEEIYIKQMVLKLQETIKRDDALENLRDETVNIITKCLSASQKYMREERDVCSFVSLRDVERTIITFKWFYQQLPSLSAHIQKAKTKGVKKNFSPAIQALMHALGVCYHVTLDNRQKYRRVMATMLQVSPDDILDEISACQNVFINAIELEKDIGRNEALTENVFMVVVCAELRIPLFLVGKPGSSKSLAKTIVTDAMQGRNSKSDLFKRLKQIHVLSFQCSALSDAVGIESVFNQCARLQKNQSLDEFVAVVVLDEIGLAEDSPKMPLKVLHPLLENASTNTQLAVDPHSKVGFVGISNWALDPAKMNRGIFVTRGKPSEGDLQKTAEAIFESDKEKIKQVSNGVIKALTSAYLNIYEHQQKEFFGLRDYYGLLKMLCALITDKNEVFFGDIARLVLRNFSGYGTKPFEVFRLNLIDCFDHVYNLKVPVMDLIQENLTSNFESRFLLLLTNQYSAVSLLPKVMDFSEIATLEEKTIAKASHDYQVIFGSSFPRDNDYTEVCRNINRIKVCMETGRTVVLLNLRDLYESLYDALNQHYVTFAGQRYVDLGLGGHRVKCRIATNFRLIVIEEKDIVYEEFPIPLINRLEKHVFEMNSVLTDEQGNVVELLREWVSRFVTFKRIFNLPHFSKEDTFPGYTDDTPASALVSSHKGTMDETKKILLQTASLDGVCRLPKTSLTSNEARIHLNIYMDEQNHDSLQHMLKEELFSSHKLKVFEITSFSQILHDKDRLVLESELHLDHNSIMLLTLQQFQTERRFSERLDSFFNKIKSSPNSQYIMLIQCPQAQLYGNLIACAKYATMNKVKEFQPYSEICKKVLVLFLFTMDRNINAQNGKACFTSFHSQNCDSLYIDELKPSRKFIAPVSYLWNLTVPAMLQHALQNIGPQNQVLDLERLVNDSIPEAIAKLKNDGQALRRNRVGILNELCFKQRYSAAFLEIIGKHILHLMIDQEKQRAETDSWIVEVACSPQALQEAGSFKYAVWLHLRKLTAVAIAKIVSVLDADNNLDVVEDVTVKEFWLRIFDCPAFFNLHWPDSRLVTTFFVKTQFSCSFPFFRVFVDHLNKQWIIIEESKFDDARGKFLEGMHGTVTSTLLDSIPSKLAVTLSKMFVHDLVCQQYKSRLNDSQLELETIESCIFNLFQAQREKGAVDSNAIVEVFILYKAIQSSLDCFSSVIAVSSDILQDGPNWINEQLQHSDFVAHKLALASLVKKLHDEAPTSIGAVDTCEKWKALVSKTKPVAYGIISDCPDEIQQMWTRVVFVEIFLDQLVPAAAAPKIVEQYLATVAPNARRLSIGARKFNQLSHLQFLNIVTKALEGCIKEIETRLLCKWQDIKCRACRANRIVDPVLLPCKHYVCLNCIPAQQAADRSCAKCRVKIPEDFELEPVTLSVDQGEELKRFRSACTSFFLEYLSTFCFPDNQPPVQVEQKMLELVLERLVICDRSFGYNPGVMTNFGLDFVARSFILQLLIGSNPDYVEELLNNHLQAIRSEQNKAPLFDIYIHCDRNILQSNVANIDEDGDDDVATVDFALKLFYQCVEIDTTLFNQLRHLDYCVKMQCIVQATVSSIYTLHNEKVENAQARQYMTRLVLNVSELCQDEKFDMAQRAIVKELCQKYGMEAFNILVENDHFRKLIPMFLLPDKGDEEKDKTNFYLESDMLMLCGRSYQNTKTHLQRVTKPGDFPGVFQMLVHEIQQSQDSIFQILLALSTWTGKGAVSKKLRRETFKNMTERLHTHFAGKSYQQTFSDIAENKLNCCKYQGLSDQMHHRLSELLTVFCLTTLWRGDGLLADLVGLMNDPKQYKKAFLPTMPASSYFQVKDLLAQDIGGYGLAPKAFLCPNGHLYFIGECTRANQSAICPDCRQPIGGQSYDKLHAGNVVGDITEESQSGYKLKPAKEHPLPTPERSLSKLSVCALRFCLHTAMFLGCRNGNAIAEMVGNNNPSVFLTKHMVKDLTDLSQFLGRNIDDTIILLHEILTKMRLSTIPIDQGQCNLKSMKGREQWEKEFQRHYLTMVFKNADNIINKAQTVLVDAGNMTGKPLECLVFDLDVDDNLPPGIVRWDCPYLWKSRKHIDIKHLHQKLEAVDASAGGEGAVLKSILNMEDLHLIQYLDVILNLQSTVIGRYRQKIDLSDAERLTVNDFLEDDEFLSEAKVDLYIRIWNKVRHALAKFPAYETLSTYFNNDMNRDSPIAMCIPSKRGMGRCAYVLVEYLSEKQNYILQQCRDNIKPKPSFAQVDISKVSKRDIICIRKKKDLMSLIQANHQYETNDATSQSGPRQNIIYDFGLLEKKVVEKFVLRKSEIQCETIPLIQYPQDVGLSKDCDAVQKNIKQMLLPIRMCHDLDTFVENARTANICEAVRTVTIVIQFLAKLGAEAELTICDYSEKELLLPPEETEMIPRSALISHCLALYERLSWHRSKRLIQNGQNPFENVLECAEKIEDKNLIEMLKEELKGMNIERLQLELNALMMVGPEIQPDWSLGSDVLIYYLDGKHDDVDNSWCEKLPDEILYKHAAHVFELSMGLVDN